MAPPPETSASGFGEEATLSPTPGDTAGGGDDSALSVVERMAKALLSGSTGDQIANGRPVHLPGAAAGLLVTMDFDAVAGALARGTDMGAISANKKGEPYMRDNIYLAYTDQATLSLSGAERFFPALLEVCEVLGQRSFDYVTARLLLEPPGGRGGPPLLADADLLAVQLRGTRRLSLIRPLHNLPVTAPRPQPQLVATVQAGDAVFVPAGLECRVMPPEGATDDGPQLHALLTLRSKEQDMEASLAKYLNDLVRDASLSKDVDNLFRSSVTRRTWKELDAQGEVADASAKLPTRLAGAAEELASRVSAAGLREHYARRMEKLRQEQREGAEKVAADLLADVSQKEVVSSSSMIRVSGGVQCRCRGGETVALFKRGSETLNLPIAESASYLIADLCDGNPHRVGSLRCADPFERISVCQILVFKGCLELC